MLRRNLLFVQKYNLHTCSSRLSSSDVLRKGWNEARAQGNVRRQVWRGCDFEGFREFRRQRCRRWRGGAAWFRGEEGRARYCTTSRGIRLREP